MIWRRFVFMRRLVLVGMAPARLLQRPALRVMLMGARAGRARGAPRGGGGFGGGCWVVVVARAPGFRWGVVGGGLVFRAASQCGGGRPPARGFERAHARGAGGHG